MLADLTERVRSLVDGKTAPGFDVRFDLGDGEKIHVASEDGRMVVTNDDAPAATTIRMTSADLLALLDGELEPMGAFMSGRLRVEGDMSKVMQLGNLF